MTRAIVHTCMAERPNGSRWLAACYLSPGEACVRCGARHPDDAVADEVAFEDDEDDTTP